MENLTLIGFAIFRYLSSNGRAAIRITPKGYVSKHIKASETHVLIDEQIVCSGDPEKWFQTLWSAGSKHG
ncbi:MAG: hypothetical protein RMI79_04990 [Nitrososphaerota archaeon]|nr:hypothetical protein [Nitrososphaerota archaeon]